MIRAFNRGDVETLLEGFSHRQSVAFIASCADRLSDFYWAFSIEENIGSITSFHMVLHFLWAWSHGGDVRDHGTGLYRRELAALAPRSDHVYLSVFTEPAGYACEVVETALDVIDGESIDRLIDASILTQTAVEMYLAIANQVYWRNPDATTQELTSKTTYSDLPLFKAELEKQFADSEVLRSAGDISLDVVEHIRRSGPVGVAPVRRFRLDVLKLQ